MFVKIFRSDTLFVQEVPRRVIVSACIYNQQIQLHQTGYTELTLYIEIVV